MNLQYFGIVKTFLRTMVRRLLTVSCGQADVQLDDAHGVLADGKNLDTSDDASFRCFFEETNGGLFVPINLSVDLEPNVIDIRNGDCANLFNAELLLYGEEDAANNFARGHCTVGKEIIDKVNDRMIIEEIKIRI